MSKITVTTIAGATSGADANKVKIESGDELNVVNGDLTVDTDTLFVDASADKVGINQASPTYQLSVLGTTQSTVEIESASTTGESRLYMTDPDSTGVGEIGYYHNGDTMRFNTGGVERIRLSSAGLHIGGTGAANALDDYEEGTFDPTITGESPCTITHSARAGYYTKVGRLVNVQISLTVGSISNGASNKAVSFGGLPFTTNTQQNATGAIRIQSLGSSVNQMQVILFNNATGGRIEEFTGTAGTNASDHVGVGTSFDISLTYSTA